MTKYLFQKGYTPWNKGLTAETNPIIKRTAEQSKNRVAWNKGQTKKEFPQLKGNTLPRSEETRRLISLHNKSRTPEIRLKLSNSHKGKHLSEETKKKLSLFRWGNKNMLGKHLSEETKLKISIAHRGKHFSEATRNKMRINRLHQIFPKKDTLPERIVQQALTELKIPFTTHKSILGQPDIFIEPNICIFIDGDYWHGSQEAQIKDVRINKILKEKGYFVIRIWEHELRKYTPSTNRTMPQGRRRRSSRLMAESLGELNGK